MDKYYQIHRAILLRCAELKACGANQAGGGGFRQGNTCARGNTTAPALSAAERKIAKENLNKIPDVADLDGHVDMNAIFKASRAVDFRAPVPKGKIGVEKTVDLDSLTAGQLSAPRAGLIAYIQKWPKSPQIPQVAILKGDPQNRTIILSGHTRLSTQVLAGRKSAKVFTYKVEFSTREFE